MYSATMRLLAILSRNRTPGLAKPCRKRSVVENPLDRDAERRGLVLRHEKPTALADELSHSSRVRCNDGRSRR